MENEDQILTIKIDYKNSISLSDFREALNGWDSQYKNFTAQYSKGGSDDRLLIKKITDGSIIIDVISPVLPLLSDFNTIAAFFVSTKKLIDWLSTKTGNKPKMQYEDLENVKKTVAPVNGYDDRQIKVSISGDNYAPIIIKSDNAEVITNNANKEIQILEKGYDDVIVAVPSIEYRENVTLQLVQIKNDNDITKNTKGIISEIEKNEHPIMFVEGIKELITHRIDNPFLNEYLVDIKINKMKDNIKSYTILKLHDSYLNEGDLFS